MTREEAEKYINILTLEEKLQLNAILVALEQKRQSCHDLVAQNLKK